MKFLPWRLSGAQCNALAVPEEVLAAALGAGLELGGPR